MTVLNQTLQKLGFGYRATVAGLRENKHKSVFHNRHQFCQSFDDKDRQQSASWQWSTQDCTQRLTTSICASRTLSVTTYQEKGGSVLLRKHRVFFLNVMKHI